MSPKWSLTPVQIRNTDRRDVSMSQLSIIVLASFLLASFSSGISIRLDWKMVDEQEHQQIVLIYENSTSDEMCITRGEWPTETGKLSFAADSVALLVGAQRFPIRDFNTGTCIGDCRHHVLPGKTLVGKIPYNHFNLPKVLWNQDKKLDFRVHGYRCKDDP